MSVSDLPLINATLNGCATVLLIAGYRAILQDRRHLHRQMMLSAVAVSALFLACYLYYHFNVELVTRYQKEDWTRPLYFLILFTHIPLAAGILPFIFRILYLAFAGRFAEHKSMAKWVWATWLYVSITGVLIYLMLYQF